jgi:hypothetical protein
MDKAIEEFIPIELIIVYDINDIPEQYYELILSWICKKYKYEGNLISDVWDIGCELRIVHWEWRDGDDYYLVVDITGFPNDKESGIISIYSDIIFENNNQKLKILSKKSPLSSRVKAFEHLRKYNCNIHTHCKHISDLYVELKDDLQEESVDEDELKEIIHTEYIHASEDDASDLS